MTDWNNCDLLRQVEYYEMRAKEIRHHHWIFQVTFCGVVIADSVQDNIECWTEKQAEAHCNMVMNVHLHGRN